MKGTRSAALRGGLLFGAVSLTAWLAPRAAWSAEKDRPWIEVRSPRFTVMSDGSESQARATARHFEEIRAVFQGLSPGANLDSGRPFTIVAVRDEASLRRLLPGFWETRGGARPAGIFLGDAPRVFVILRLDAEDDDATIVQSVIFHEYVHFLIKLNFDAIPLWLDEGLADFYATSTAEGDRIVVGRAAPWNLRLLKDKPGLPLEALLAVDPSSPYYNERDRATIFYAQSWALAHYLLNQDKGAHRPQLTAYLKEIAAGAGPVEAGRRAFGDLTALGRKLDTYVHGPVFYTIPVAMPELPAPRTYAVRTLPRPEVLALQGHVYVVTGRTKEAHEVLDEASRLEPTLGATWESLCALAILEGRLEDAARAAQEAVRQTPSSFLAHFMAGTAAQARREFAAADAALQRSIEINDRFAPAYVMLATVKAALHRPSPEVLAPARKAAALEPGNALMQFALAAVFRDAGELLAAQRLGDRALRMGRTPGERAAIEQLLAQLKRSVPSDKAGAARHHEAACQAGEAASCVSLAISHEKGDGMAKDLVRAAELYGRACEAGEPTGCSNLGRMNAYGIGMAKDPGRARALYEKACPPAGGLACESLARLLLAGEGGAADPARAVTLLSRECAGGDRSSCTLLGWMHEEGKGVATDVARAAELYDKACAIGDPDACHRQGRLYANAGPLEDEARAYLLFEKACNGGNAEGCASLAYCLQEGHGVAVDLPRSAAAYSRACDAGAAASCAQLGSMYAHGEGVDKDQARAFALFQKACDTGDPYGCRAVAAGLQGGRGVAADSARAAELLAKGCEGGQMDSCVDLGSAYERGDGVTRDRRRAGELYQKACDADDGYGCLSLALFHSPANPSRARPLFQKACDHQEAAACGQLGLLHVGGLGGAQDYKQGARLLGQGCDGGDAQSCSALAGLAEAGQGTTRDLARARSLYEKACAAGYPPACDSAKRLSR